MDDGDEMRLESSTFQWRDLVESSIWRDITGILSERKDVLISDLVNGFRQSDSDDDDFSEPDDMLKGRCREIDFLLNLPQSILEDETSKRKEIQNV